MSIGDWFAANMTGVIGLMGVISGAVVAVFQTWRTSKVQLKQIRPEVIPHRCRVGAIDVYTYFDEDNKTSEPACVYLAADGSRNCEFNPQNRDTEEGRVEAKQMLEINGGKCYLSLWGKKS